MNSAKIPLAAAALVARFTGAGFLFAASRIGGRCPVRGLWRFGGERGFGCRSRSAVCRLAEKGWRKRVFAGGGKRRPLLSRIGAGVSAAAMRRKLFFFKKLNLELTFAQRSCILCMENKMATDFRRSL